MEKKKSTVTLVQINIGSVASNQVVVFVSSAVSDLVCACVREDHMPDSACVEKMK